MTTGRRLPNSLTALEWIPQVKRTEQRGPNTLKRVDQWNALNTGLILQDPVQRQRGQIRKLALLVLVLPMELMDRTSNTNCKLTF